MSHNWMEDASRANERVLAERERDAMGEGSDGPGRCEGIARKALLICASDPGMTPLEEVPPSNHHIIHSGTSWDLLRKRPTNEP
jgi:hypothetical protein